MSRTFTRHFLVFLFAVLSGLPLARRAQSEARDHPPKVVQEWFQLPVLKFKENNPVLRIQVSVGENQPLALSEIVLGTNGTTSLQDIDAVRIYYDRRNTTRLQLDTSHEDVTLFGEAGRIRKKTRISGELQLPQGTHTFWVSMELSPLADITHRVAISCLDVRLDGRKICPEQVNDPLLLRMGTAVRLHGQDGVHTSRIPGLATTNKGTLLAIFDARYNSARDLQGHMDIGLHRSTDGGNSWEPIRIPMDMGEWGGLPEKFNGVSDACILVDRNSDAIYIAGLWMHGVLTKEGEWVEGLTEESEEWNHQWRNKASQPGYGVKQTSQFLIVKSTDDGKTWSEPENLTRMGKKEDWWLWAPAPGRGITLNDGTLVFPAQGRNASGKGFSTITYSKDGGKTWTTGNPATMAVEVSTTECAVVQLSDGSLMLNMRSGKNRGNTGDDNGRPIAVSHDMGETWQEHPTSFGALPEPTCMASLYRHEYENDGTSNSVLVFSNPNSKKFRENITVKVSLDDGRTWPERNQLLLDEGRGRGYSCLTSLGDEYIGILYESSQADLVFQKIPLSTLLTGPQIMNEQTR